MKKLICLLICVSLALTLLASCGGGDESGTESAAESESVAASIAENNGEERSAGTEQPQYGESEPSSAVGQPDETSSAGGDASEDESQAEESAETDWSIPPSDASKTLFTFRGTKITAGEYAFGVSMFKAYIKEMYLSYLGYGEDAEMEFNAYLRTPTYDANGELVPVFELMSAGFTEQTKYSAVIRQLCAEYGLEVTDEEMIEYLEDALQAGIDSAGGPQAFDRLIGKFGLSKEELKQTYYMDSLLDSLLFEYLYGEDGIRRADAGYTDEELRALFESTYYKYDSVVYQPAMYYEESMTEEAFDALDAEVSACARATYEKIISGELDLGAYSDEDTMPDGYGIYVSGLVTDGTYEDEELIELLDGLKEGECALYEDYYGDIYIVIKRTPGDEDFEDYYDYFYTSVLEDEYIGYLESLFDEVETDEEELAKYDFLTVPTIG